MSSDPLVNMWISFIAIGLMFFSVMMTIFGREKLRGIIRYMVLTVSFFLIVIAGIIILLTLIAGPTTKS